MKDTPGVNVQVCPACGAENGEQAKFCRSCGAALAEAGRKPVCAACGAALREGAAFCAACGAEIRGEAGSTHPAAGPAGGKRQLPVPAWTIAAAATIVAAVAIAVAAILVPGDGGDDGDGRVDSGLVFAEPVALSDQAKDDLQAALDALPEPVGDTDAEQIHSVLGPPDIFQLWFEPLEDGATARIETWFYLDLEVSYEFRDGDLLFTIPMEEVPGLVLVPLRYDPLAFDDSTTVDDLRAMLDDPADLKPEETPEEYGFGVTVWAGEQVFAAFDENGELLYVETVAMDLGGEG